MCLLNQEFDLKTCANWNKISQPVNPKYSSLMIQVQYENSWINIWMREYISWDTHHLLMFCINVHHHNSHELQRLLPSNYQRCENIVSMLMTTVCCLSLFSRLKLNQFKVIIVYCFWYASPMNNLTIWKLWKYCL